MIVDIATCLCIIGLTVKIVLLEIEMHSIESRNIIQHRRYERDIAKLSSMSKLHLNSLYGKLAYMDTDSIKVEKED